MGRIRAEAESHGGQPACLGLMNWLIHSPLICLVVALMRFHALVEAIAIQGTGSGPLRGPELIFSVFVALVLAKLDRKVIGYPPDVYLGRFPVAAVPFG